MQGMGGTFESTDVAHKAFGSINQTFQSEDSLEKFWKINFLPNNAPSKIE